jgi:hypothetical protein
MELEQAGNKIQHKVVVCDKAGEALNDDLCKSGSYRKEN